MDQEKFLEDEQTWQDKINSFPSGNAELFDFPYCVTVRTEAQVMQFMFLAVGSSTLLKYSVFVKSKCNFGVII